jgi:hypothetical protein
LGQNTMDGIRQKSFTVVHGNHDTDLRRRTHGKISPETNRNNAWRRTVPMIRFERSNGALAPTFTPLVNASGSVQVRRSGVFLHVVTRFARIGAVGIHRGNGRRSRSPGDVANSIFLNFRMPKPRAGSGPVLGCIPGPVWEEHRWSVRGEASVR